MSKDDKNNIKILFLGQMFSGKRSMAHRFCERAWDDEGFSGWCTSLTRQSFFQSKLDIESPYFIENESESGIVSSSSSSYNNSDSIIVENEWKRKLYYERRIQVDLKLFMLYNGHQNTLPILYLTNLNGCCLVYDVLLPVTAISMKNHYGELVDSLERLKDSEEKEAEQRHSKLSSIFSNLKEEESVYPMVKDIIFFVVAAKADRINADNHDQANDLFNEVDQWRLSKGINHHFLTSTKTNLNIDSLFHTMTLEILKLKASKINKVSESTESTKQCNIITDMSKRVFINFHMLHTVHSAKNLLQTIPKFDGRSGDLLSHFRIIEHIVPIPNASIFAFPLTLTSESQPLVSSLDKNAASWTDYINLEFTIERRRLENGIKQHIITSAKDNFNIQTLFYNMILEVTNIKSNKQPTSESLETMKKFNLPVMLKDEIKAKILFLGSLHVGKRSVVERFCRLWDGEESSGWNVNFCQYQLYVASPYFIENDNSNNSNNNNDYNKEEHMNELKRLLYSESRIKVALQVFIYGNYHSVPPRMHLAGLHGCFLVYDLLLPQTAISMKKYFEDLVHSLNSFEQQINDSNAKVKSPDQIQKSRFPLVKDIIFIVVTSMADKINTNNHDQATETFNEVERWRLSKGINHHFLTSSKVNLNIQSLFHTMTLDILKHRASKIDYETSSNVETSPNSTKYCNIICI
ncbi:hypothetical protein PPL_06157 [Heterostelium album PN500]|uniref:Uncharacterized protein n=1 Tax=Heterostelium pallidum (strain ATCC 26659 / Pp 5 / PN500) TaxID=670386 RepID=D3BCD2_HETP5|nr:hypothetical protein PPL_06157 [Heterostelium album PN500]EFA80922.1 hypothetical protein PPL_06157 [Heterostelium album PN500]|eukprot:XP_020433040.1 hypothetical protein PPL_06157 [Heterostelium album PN500]